MGLFPEDVSTTGHMIDGVFWLAMWLTGVTFLIIVGILVVAMVRFRERPDHKARFVRGDSRKAVVRTLIFASVVFVVLDLNLAYYDFKAFEAVVSDAPSEDEALVIDVRAQQFAWNFRFAGDDGKFGKTDKKLVNNETNRYGLVDEDPAGEDDLTSIGIIYIPVNKPVIFKMSSNDVIHSFFLPNFRIKQDVLPGMTTMLHIEATKTGSFEIVCAELCGLGHYSMRGQIDVVSEEDFKKKIDEMKAAKEDEFF